MLYELYYWPGIQGRGEFARLVLEDAGAEYVDVGRQPDGVAQIRALMRGEGTAPFLPFGPPFLRAGELWLGQSAAIAAFLGERLGLAPAGEQDRLSARTLGLTLADLVAETHDTHHPISTEQFYEEHREVAAQRAAAFRSHRMPKYLRHLEHNLVRNSARTGQGVLVGDQLSYVDLAAFQVVEGLSYAFPRTMAQLKSGLPLLLALRHRVAERPRLAAYLSSERRLPFNERGIFRHYPELDA